MDQPFFEIYVQNVVEGGTTVYWGLKRGFNDGGPYSYRVQWAEAKHAQWQDVDTGPLIDVYSAIDPSKRMWAKELESYYRIILTTADGEYVSLPQQASGTWKKREWLIGREICRKEWLRLKKQVGVPGYLLKRKIFGPKCTACTDWDNQSDSSNSSCEICWGTGVVGGYWPAIPTFVDSDLIPRGKQNDDTAGNKEDLVTKGRLFGYPHVATYDIFVDVKTDRRWVLHKVDNVAELRGQPLIYSAELRLAPFTDPIYRIPVGPPTPPTSSSNVPPYPDAPPFWTSSSSSSPPPVASTCVSCCSSSSVSSSSSMSSVSSQSSSSPLCPTPPPFPDGHWLWWDECSESWVFGTVGSLDTWYTSEQDQDKAFPYLPSYDWYPVQGPLPQPKLTYVSGGFEVTEAGAWWMRGLYKTAGTHNGTYAYQGSPYSSSSAVPVP